MKKLKTSCFIMVVTFLLFYNNGYSQELGISLGAMKNYTPTLSSNSHYSFYPEISISNKFFSQYFNWELAIGYVNDGLEPDEKGYFYWGKDYNSSDYILSTRIIINSSKIFQKEYLPKLIVGSSLHIVISEYVYFPEIDLGYISDEEAGRIYFDIGAEYKIAEIWGISIVPRYMLLTPISRSELLSNSVKHSFVISFKY